LQKLLERQQEGVLTPSQLEVLAKQLAAEIELTQKRNRRSRRSHAKRRRRELRRLGIRLSALPCADDG
jgi:hypothetical protein